MKENNNIIVKTNGKEIEFNLDMAIIIAKCDYELGISFAMEQLNKFGIETPIYWIFLEQTSENDLDYDEYEMNIDCRDLQYRALNIYDIMQKAYELMEFGYYE